ncbi:MAG: RelA/SpoT family protein [Deltaproteobacteria bacterium]
MLRLNDIVEKVTSYLYLPESDVETIKRAYVYSAMVHADQKRSSGEPYLSHPLEVCGILADLKLDVPSIVTGLLHDTVEDTLATMSEIESMFGREVSALVDGVTKISQLPFSTKLDEQAENFRKLILATARDIRVILVKLADRLHNMRTLESLSAERQKRISKETSEIFAPLAYRLGIYWMGTELEDLSFRYLNPEEYSRILKLVAKRKKEWEKYVEEVRGILRAKLAEFSINADITGRLKHIYGIYSKMQSQNIEFDKVYDVTAFRIITPSLKECYEALGAVHSSWKPVPGRFKDYIALPKGNGYQSLHTTVIGPFNQRMEVQIRTNKMHEVAEYGVAAHWKYKHSDSDNGDNYKIYATLRQLLEWKDIKDPTDFLDAIKGELIENSVYVFTPNADLKEMPAGSTPVDFAYAVHTEVGNHCARATVNDKIVPLDHKLRSGDTVKITTLADKNPSRDWLKFTVSSRAKAKIRAWFRGEEITQSKLIGKSICERKFKQSGLDFPAMLRSGDLDAPLAQLKVKDADEFYLSVGYGKLSVADLLKLVLSKEKIEPTPEKQSRIQRIIKNLTRSTKNGVLVKGSGDVLIRFAHCCSPIPGEDILGYITRGRGVTIHKHNCQEVLSIDPERRIEAVWDRDFKGQRPAKIIVVCNDRPGMLSSITKSIASSEVNITKAEVHSTDVERSIGTFEISVSDLGQLEGIMNSIKRVKGVISVERILAGESAD